MKLATYIDSSGSEKVGAVVNDDKLIVDLQAAHSKSGETPFPAFDSMLALIEAGPDALDHARSITSAPPDDCTVKVGSVKLLSPLPRPTALRDFLSFEAHIGNALKKGFEVGIFPASRTIPDVWYEAPRYYKCNSLNMAGEGADVQWPSYSERMDFELEIGWVIGKKGKNIEPENALEHVFGFTIYNDLSARDSLFNEMGSRLGPAKGKDFDGGNVLGPWIVTMDEIGDPHNLEMTAHINGEEWSRGNSGEAYHKIEDCIAYASKEETIHPGEVFGSGTVGTGSGVEFDRYVQNGDTVALSIEKIGTLTIRLHGPSARPYAETLKTNVKFKH